VVAAFLTLAEGVARPEDEEVREWTRMRLGRHKAPKYVFVSGVDEGLPGQVPQTGSGKVQKQGLRELGTRLLEEMEMGFVGSAGPDGESSC
jgi:acyl-CoA synthetase (AMP-forming)/AMP-acid ligase II